MKRLVTILVMILLYSSAIAQQKIEVEYTAKLNCSQKYGLDIYDGEFVMTIEFDDLNLKFNSEKDKK